VSWQCLAVTAAPAAGGGSIADAPLLLLLLLLLPLLLLLLLSLCPGSHGGEHVQVEGSFDNWSTRQQLQRSGREFTVIKLLPPGVYQVC
jgi:hypothetical protein